MKKELSHCKKEKEKKEHSKYKNPVILKDNNKKFVFKSTHCKLIDYLTCIH